MAVRQFSGIGSSLTVATKDGSINSLADGMATALYRYMKVKREHGLEAMLLGRVGSDESNAKSEAGTSSNAGGSSQGSPMSSRPMSRVKRERDMVSYKVKCPACSSNLAFEEGCMKCYGCGFSKC
jgi:hypothetical protein